MQPKQYTFTVISNREIAPEIFLLSIKSNEKANYLAGQYYSFKIEEKIHRSYSIASAPEEENIDFIIERIEGGIGSTYLSKLKAGDSFEALGSLGFLTLEKANVLAENSPLIFIATGTGIVPMRSMIRHLLLGLKSDRKITLYFGLRFDNKAYLHDEFFELAKQFPNFEFFPIISKPSENWKGEIGHCQDIIMRNPVDSTAKIFICGSNSSVDGISTDLISHGYEKEKMFFEKFGE